MPPVCCLLLWTREVYNIVYLDSIGFFKTPYIMTPFQFNKIYPCPLSKGYGIPVEQAWSLLKIFFLYRFIVSSLFMILFYSQYGPSLLGINNAEFYNNVSLAYWLVCLLSGFFVFWRTLRYSIQAQIVILSDILFITLLMHASGGINSGIGILLAITIAAGGLLIGGRCAIFFAAFASLAILAEQLYIIQTALNIKTSFTYAGMLGASFFTTAFLSYVLAQRTEQSEILASQHKQTISNLEELNQYIIQYMQSGIIISNAQQQIKMCNESALNIIYSTKSAVQPQYLFEVAPKLTGFFQQWLDDIRQDYALIMLPNHREIYFRFSLLKTRQETFYMIILEDISLYNQKLQQSKLASLGRLTASIAHEIRNPLGAISHAGQLLSEAPNLLPEDQRLTEIIQSHCQRVNKIIEDVLQLSRREPSKREKINLNEWINNSLHNFNHDMAYDASNFIIETIDIDVWVYMDTGHLKQIFDNLCSNALKYGNVSEHKIIIEICVLDGFPSIKVIDSGEKMNEGIVEQLFEPFFTTSSTGTGLGLYISKELAEINQAKLTYAVTDDDKNCFILSLPHAEQSVIEL